MTRPASTKATRLLRIAALLTILGLVFVVWSLVQPTPLPVMLAMSVGQLIGTAAFGIYVYVVITDFLRTRRARKDSGESPGE